MKILEAGCGISISHKRKESLEGLDIAAGLIRKDSTDARKHRTEILLLLTDDMMICLEIADMDSHAILCFGGDYGRNIEVLDSIVVDVFSIVLIGRVYNNKDCFEDTDYNKPIYNFSLAVPANTLEIMQPLSASYVSGLRIILNILI